MLQTLFTLLTNYLNSNSPLGFLAALIWGMLSVLLSPCHLATIPLIVGFVSHQEKTTVQRAFQLSLAFSIGILITIGIIGAITAFLGRMLGDLGPWSNYFVAIVFVIVGLYLMGVFRIEIPGASQAKIKGSGTGAAFLLGLLFGLALGPCTFAFMAPILVIVFTKSASNLVYGIPLLLIYGIGHCAVIVFAGTFTKIIENYLRWSENAKALLWVKRICGLLLIVAAGYMIWN